MIKIQSLSVAYGKHLAIQDISLSVQAGEILAIIGPNGAGKSTLIRAVSGILPAVSGKIWMGDANLTDTQPAQRARHLAVVPQASNLPGSFSVYQTVLMGRTPYLGWIGQASEIDHAHVRLALKRTQTFELAERPVGELSGGEQQRVLLARALAQDTKALLLDEPTTHLDLQHQSGLLNLVRQLASDKSLAVMMVLHDLNLASLYADKVALLVDGRLQASGDPTNVLTEENLAATYHVPVHIIPHPQYGSPLILPNGKK
ncbi:heme ABC transporter ATP-binding protein [Chloroflexota bacterium]